MSLNSFKGAYNPFTPSLPPKGEKRTFIPMVLPRVSKEIEGIMNGAISRLVHQHDIPQLELFKPQFFEIAMHFTRRPAKETGGLFFDCFKALNIYQLQPHQQEEMFKFWEDVSQELWTKVGRGGVNL